MNSARVGKLEESHIDLLNSCKVENVKVIPDSAVYLFAEGSPKDKLNEDMVRAVQYPQVHLPAHAQDKFPPNATDKHKEKVLSMSQTECHGLASILYLKKIMITTNIDIEDRLIHDQMGTIFEFKGILPSKIMFVLN